MDIALTVQLTLWGALGALAAHVIRDDIVSMEIPAGKVLTLTVLAILHGILFPLPRLDADAALLGAAVGLGLGTLTRAYIHLRTGIAAFGGADIALLTAGGGLLGPLLLGPFTLGAGALAVLGALLPATALRTTHLEEGDADVRALPFCPALLISAAALYAAAHAGLVPATF